MKLISQCLSALAHAAMELLFRNLFLQNRCGGVPIVCKYLEKFFAFLEKS